MNKTLKKKNNSESIIKNVLFAIALGISAIVFVNFESAAQEKENKLYIAKPNVYISDFLKKNNFYAIPYLSGIEIAQEKDQEVIPEATEETSEDSTSGDNEIISLVQKNGHHNLRARIKEKDMKIKIEVYNLLAKKVLDVYEGLPHKDSDNPYRIESAALPDGVYLCVLQGIKFRLIEKFIVSR